MKVEPPVVYSSLIARVGELYQLAAHSLAFMPAGETSYSYVVSCLDSQRYFLKLWPNSRQGLAMRARLEIVLPLARELFERGLVPDLVGPIPAISGELLNTFGEYGLALYPFVEGRPLPENRGAWPPDMVGQLAETFARLHQSAGVVKSRLPQRSAFDMSFSADLRAGLRALDSIGPQSRPGLVNLRGMLDPRRADLLRMLAEVEDLCIDAQHCAGPLVLCHTDMGGDNLLVDSTGRLSILDWDDLILAPAEHDLQSYRGDGFARFIRLYNRAGGIPSLQPIQFAFYLKRRYLADLTDWLVRILEENTTFEQDRYDLQGIERYCLAYLDRFPAEMEEISAALASA